MRIAAFSPVALLSSLLVGALGCQTTGHGRIVAKGTANVGSQEVTLETQVEVEAEEEPEETSVKYEKETRQLTYKGDSIKFAYNEAKLEGEETFKTLRDVLKFLKDHPQVTMEVEAHTDSRGEREYNRTLSSQRAAAIKAWLVAEGIDGGRLKPSGRGEDDAEALEPKECFNVVPKDVTPCEDGWARSRQAKFKLLTGTETIVTKKVVKQKKTVARVEDPPEKAPDPKRVWFLAGHGGIAAPSGELASEVPMSDYVGYAIPLGVGFGYWIRPKLSLGLDASLVPMLPPTKPYCGTPPCKLTPFGWRVEAMLEGHGSTGPAPSWWYGLGLGLEGLSLEVTPGGGPTSQQSRGGVYLAGRLGVDWFVSPRVRLGPLVEATGGWFFPADGEFAADPRLMRSNGQHAYLGLGLRAALDFFDR